MNICKFTNHIIPSVIDFIFNVIYWYFISCFIDKQTTTK